MDGRLTRRRLSPVSLLLLFGAAASCKPRTEVERLPAPQETLARAGKRLSQSLSAGALTEIAAQGDRVLRALNTDERDALARGYLRFRVDQPAVLTVAAPRGSVPFWVADLRFRRTNLSLADPETDWAVFQKTVDPGDVGLGVNGLDRTPPAHYVVFLQTASGAPLVPASLRADSWRVVTAAEGMSLAAGVDRPVRSLPASLRGATLLQPSHDRRHSTLLARGRVWKTHVAAGRRPDQVTVDFGADAARELVWSWRTEPSVERSVVRYYRLGPGLDTPPAVPPGSVVEVRGESRTLETPDLLNDPVVRRHSAGASGLGPGTAYVYQVGDGTPGGMSPWSVVRTGPRPGRDAHLIYLGDPQCGLEGWGKLLAGALRRRPDAGAVLIAGDLVDRGNERSNWDHFFLRAAGSFERVAVMPAVGNHEYLDMGPRLYRAFFKLPANGPDGAAPGLVYAFEYGDVFVAVLDSTLAVSDPRAARKQVEWLDGRLSRTACPWKLVMFHHPVYASHVSRENLPLRDAWVPVFDRHSVDLVLQGHDHAYLRTYPMRANRRASRPGEGTVYVVSVSGDKYYDQDPRDYAEVAFTHTSTYQTIDLDATAGRLLYRAWDGSGTERDRLELVKPSASNRLASRPGVGRR
jgi:hypothetical protein